MVLARDSAIRASIPAKRTWSLFELVDFRFDTGDIGFGGDRFGERVAEGVGGGSGLLLGERSGFEPIDVGEAVEEELGGHGRQACRIETE